MKLRHKFGLLAFLYVITLAANFALCSWCLLLYYRSFLERRSAEAPSINAVNGEWRDDRHSGSAAGIANMDGPGPGDSSRSDTEATILRILGGNALCGLGLGFLGLRLARRWVIQPIASLRDAASELGRGNLLYRIRASSRDELGELANDVNDMASSIVAMQAQLVEQERRLVAGQVLRCVVHNIRSPLTGIRWLAEAIGMRDDIDVETARRQGRIVEIVDRVLAWLQRFRESMTHHG